MPSQVFMLPQISGGGKFSPVSVYNFCTAPSVGSVRADNFFDKTKNYFRWILNGDRTIGKKITSTPSHCNTRELDKTEMCWHSWDRWKFAATTDLGVA